MATLLLADDSSTIRRVIELTFADEGIAVVSVDGGRAAIERLRGEPPDIVLADIGMPECDGYAVGAFVKNDPALKRIPVLLLTGALEPLDEARARAVCDGVLVKPFEPQVVISRVKALLGRAGGASRSDAPLADAPAASAAPRAPRDEYFARLDAAFPSGQGEQPGADAGTHAGRDGPASASAERTTATGRTTAAAPATGSGRPVSVSLPDAFAALLAAEQGQAVLPEAASPPLVTDALIDQVAARVIERMGDASMRQAVLDAAERLVREEIARIKGTAAGPRG
jgi:CheY-like chemotaxis protein